MVTLGEQIKILRKKNNMTQVELAGKAQVTQSFISNIERNAVDPSLRSLTRVARVLGLPLHQTLKGVKLDEK